MIDELRGLAIAAARRGAAHCLRRFGETAQADTKGSAGNLVTPVDRAAEKAVRLVVLSARPTDSVLGEELPPHEGTGELQWVIDPLDGTTNFTRRIPYFATSVAVRRRADGCWLAGAVCAPALASTWSAAVGCGARVEFGSDTAKLPLTLPRSTARLLGTGLSYDPDRRSDQVGQLGALMTDYTDMRRFGAAAIDLCLVGQGSLDAFIEADLAVHDWAAGALIAQEAGAAVTRPTEPGGSLSARWS